MTVVSPQRLRELFYVDDVGVLRWKVDTKKTKAGDIAGSSHSKGYVRVSISGRKEYAHRVVWAMTHDEWPAFLIDHRDGNKRNNRSLNLRDATPSESQCNRAKQSNNATGFKGVYFDEKKHRYVAQIGVRRKHYYIGSYSTGEAAHAAYAEAAERLHGQFARSEPWTTGAAT